MAEFPTPHLEKLKATLENRKLPATDVPRIEEMLAIYEKWIADLEAVDADSTKDTVANMVGLLNAYRNRMDVEAIFDSDNDFLYRQKGQIKLDNSVLEEFLPRLVGKCLLDDIDDETIHLGPRKAFSAIYFTSSLDDARVGGGLHVRTKDQDFTIARRVYLKTSYTPDFQRAETKQFYIAYVAAECKTNLDKTMFQEASATAHDVKTAIVGAKYFLLCEWLDMTPQSTAATDIDEVLILRKAKRMSSNIRSHYGSAEGRKNNRNSYVDFLNAHPFDPLIFERFVNKVASLLTVEAPIEDDVLTSGFF